MYEIEKLKIKQPTFQDCVALMKHNFSDNFNNYLAQFEDDSPDEKKEFWWYPKDAYYKAQQDKYDTEKEYGIPSIDAVMKEWQNTKPIGLEVIDEEF